MSKENNIKRELHQHRREPDFAELDEKNISANPFDLFEQWIKLALEKEKFEPNAMTLATTSKDGAPTARIVLLRDYGPEGFVFFTNYESRKGKNLKENPQASLVFYWPSMSRQILINGNVHQTERSVSEEYFQSRPRQSQIAACASAQSRSLSSREELTGLVIDIENKFKGKEIPCPPHWGGYCLKPKRIEFWQGRPNRLHDRICYTGQSEGIWQLTRLAP